MSNPLLPEQARVAEKVKAWLTEEGVYRDEIQDEKSLFNYQVEFPRGSHHMVNVYQPRDRADLVALQSAVEFSPQHLDLLAKMAEDARSRFTLGLMLELLSRGVAFQPMPDAEDPTSVLFAGTIYYDGLTKDRLMGLLNVLYQCFLFVSWKFIQKAGGGAGPGQAPTPLEMYR